MSASNEKQPVFAQERKQQILTLLKQNQKLVVPELCRLFEVSPSTIRNDLRELQQSGLITRTHGGAIANSKTRLEPLPASKETHMPKHKKAIAQAAANFVDDGDTIAIGTGTTTMELARQLLHKSDLTVVVNDLRLASFLEENSNFTLFMLGGIVRRRFHYVNTYGTSLPNINIDTFFFTCNGLTAAEGATLPDFQLAADTAAMMKRASNTVLLCDHSKVGCVSFAQIAPLQAIGNLIVDEQTSIDDIVELQEQAVKPIIIAPIQL